MDDEKYTEEDLMRLAAAAMGRKGGATKTPKKAAACRKNLAKALEVMTPEQRHERAKKAGAARWAKAKAAQSGAAGADRPADAKATKRGKSRKGGKDE